MTTQPLANAGVVEVAINRVVDAFETIRVENGFRFDVVKVWRHLLDPESLDEIDTPCLFVVRPEGTTGTVEWYDERHYKEVLRLDVLGYLKSDGQDAEDMGLATQAEALLSDMKKLAMLDPKFGAPSSSSLDVGIKNSKIVADSNDAAFDSTGAVVGIALEVIVYWGIDANP